MGQRIDGGMVEGRRGWELEAKKPRHRVAELHRAYASHGSIDNICVSGGAIPSRNHAAACHGTLILNNSRARHAQNDFAAKSVPQKQMLGTRAHVKPAHMVAQPLVCCINPCQHTRSMLCPPIESRPASISGRSDCTA